MKKFLLPGFFVFFLAIPFLVYADLWYEFGNLHCSTVAKWNSASYAYKLATSGDMAMASSLVKSIVMQSGNIDTLKPFAINLVNCVNEAAADKGYENMKISQIAAACIILMKW
jgi:hypothetical protein